jgi:hypothetical protein
MRSGLAVAAAWVLVRSALSVLIALGAGAAGCSHPGAKVSHPPPGGTWYTQFTLQFERGRYRTTNYRRGFTLPINTEVALVSMDSDEIIVQIKSSGARLEVENVPKHTNESIHQAFDKLFGSAPVDLSRFGDAEQKAIRAGKAEVGMSREAVLAALGYPPAVGTPALESDEWKSWDSRFTTLVVRFDEDRVVDVSG